MALPASYKIGMTNQDYINRAVYELQGLYPLIEPSDLGEIVIVLSGEVFDQRFPEWNDAFKLVVRSCQRTNGYFCEEDCIERIKSIVDRQNGRTECKPKHQLSAEMIKKFNLDKYVDPPISPNDNGERLNRIIERIKRENAARPPLIIEAEEQLEKFHDEIYEPDLLLNPSWQNCYALKAHLEGLDKDESITFLGDFIIWLVKEADEDPIYNGPIRILETMDYL